MCCLLAWGARSVYCKLLTWGRVKAYSSGMIYYRAESRLLGLVKEVLLRLVFFYEWCSLMFVTLSEGFILYFLFWSFVSKS